MAVAVQSVVFAGCLLAAVAHRSRQPFQPRQPDNWLLPSLIDGGNISSEEEERERNERRCVQQREWFRNRREAAIASSSTASSASDFLAKEAQEGYVRQMLRFSPRKKRK
uniref:Putative secreted protein n=1 Tax=Ixodes ricinus TaxID=34613 RepID=A0A6B0UIY3_IXORI